jgi:hypothetical protein
MVLALLAAECMDDHHHTEPSASADSNGSAAGRITVVERCSLSYHASEALLAAHKHLPGAGLICLLPVSLDSLKRKDQNQGNQSTLPPTEHQGGAADVLMTDLFDHT